MHTTRPVSLLVAAVLAVVIGNGPSVASEPARVQVPAAHDPGIVSVRLVEIPAILASEPRARHYIIDNLVPGTVIHRRIEVASTSLSPVQVALYPDAAKIVHGAFVGAPGRTRNELTTWTKLDRKSLLVPARGAVQATVTIAVPKDAAPGERYAVLWAQAAGGKGDGVRLVNRTGIRVYLSVGGHNPPATDFTADTMTAERDPTGRAVVLAQIHNTGGRALDLSGSLNLAKVTGNLKAGPYPVQLGTTLAPGQSEPVKIVVTDQVADGPWKAALELKSGLREKTYHSRITFPHNAGVASPAEAHLALGESHLLVIGTALALLLVATFLTLAVRRRRAAGR